MTKSKQPLWYKILVAFATFHIGFEIKNREIIFKVGVDKDFRNDTFFGFVQVGNKRYSV